MRQNFKMNEPKSAHAAMLSRPQRVAAFIANAAETLR